MKLIRSDELWDSWHQEVFAAHTGFSGIYPVHPWVSHADQLHCYSTAGWELHSQHILQTHGKTSNCPKELPAGWSLPTAPLWIRADKLTMSRAHASGRMWGPTSDAISIQWYFSYSSKSFSLHKFSTEPILGISPSFVVKREKKIFLLRYIENQNFPHSLNVLSIATREAWSTGFLNLQLCHSVI